jgi:hypothetical protein
LICLSNYPYFQIQALLVLALMTMSYIAYFSPFLGRKMNINETVNEICAIMCMYTVMMFMMTKEVNFIEIMTWQFIAIVAINILYFVLQAMPVVVIALCEKCKNYQQNKKKVEKQQLMI